MYNGCARPFLSHLDLSSGCWDISQTIRQQDARRGDDVQILAQQLDLAFLGDELTDIILRVRPVSALEYGVGMVLDEEAISILQLVDLDIRQCER